MVFFWGGHSLWAPPFGTLFGEARFWDTHYLGPLFGGTPFGNPFGDPPSGAPCIWDPLGDSPLWGTPLHMGPSFGAPSFGAPPFWDPLLGLPHLGSPFGATLTLHLAGRLPNGLRAAVPAGAASWSFSGVAPQSWRGGGGVEETSPRLERLLAEKVTFHPFFWGAGRPDVAGLPASSRFGGCRSVRMFSGLRLAKI